MNSNHSIPVQALACLIATILLFAPARADEVSPQPRPVPNSAAQGRLQKEIKEQYKAEYARRTAADQLALCQLLVEQLPTYAETPARQYVMLREARELATNAGDFDAAFAVIDQTARLFTVDPRELKVSVMTAALDRALVEKPELMERYLRIAEDSLSRGDAEMAQQANDLAYRIAHASRDRAALDRIKQDSLRVHAARRELTAILAASKKLQAHPEDPEANLLVGRYVCFVKNEWEEGLPLLLRGSDKQLQALAEKDLHNPDDPISMADIADGWWTVPPSPQTPPQHARERAVHWYQRALPHLPSAQKQQAEKRIAQMKDPQPKE